MAATKVCRRRRDCKGGRWRRPGLNRLPMVLLRNPKRGQGLSGGDWHMRSRKLSNITNSRVGCSPPSPNLIFQAASQATYWTKPFGVPSRAASRCGPLCDVCTAAHGGAARTGLTEEGGLSGGDWHMRSRNLSDFANPRVACPPPSQTRSTLLKTSRINKRRDTRRLLTNNYLRSFTSDRIGNF